MQDSHHSILAASTLSTSHHLQLPNPHRQRIILLVQVSNLLARLLQLRLDLIVLYVRNYSHAIGLLLKLRVESLVQSVSAASD
jgi:hypothetical protein